MPNENRYNNLDGIRGYAAVGVALMHIAANVEYNLPGVLYDPIIASFSNFIYLFMMLSAFSLCCGYYQKFAEGKIDLNRFYTRRYQRIWPYFAILCTLDLIVEHNLNSLYEWFADLTLSYGLLPNANLGVVGVGWFLGVIFVFYMIFPFYVFLIGNKRRAWLVLGIAYVLNVLCRVYFLDSNHVVEGFRTGSSFIYCSMFFIAGGIIYLYKEKISDFKSCVKAGLLVLAIATIVIDYFVFKSITLRLIAFSSILMLCISLENKVMKLAFQNRVAYFLGGISMEVYLCHMFVFRVLQKVHIDCLFGNVYVNYWLASCATIVGAIIVAVVIKYFISKIPAVVYRLSHNIR